MRWFFLVTLLLGVRSEDKQKKVGSKMSGDVSTVP